MEEGEFVKWKQIVVGLISIMMIFTSVRGEVNENQRSNYQMLEQIEKSYVVDSGFRESNYFFLDMVDSYATYYLQKSGGKAHGFNRGMKAKKLFAIIGQ